MEKEFVNYNQALKLKKLGFDKPCFGYYWENLLHFQTTHTHPATMPNSPENCLAPTFSQAFRFFREKYNYLHEISKTYGGDYIPYVNGLELNTNDEQFQWIYKTYEEAELACLDKLIEIVEKK